MLILNGQGALNRSLPLILKGKEKIFMGVRLWKRDYEIIEQCNSGMFRTGQLARLFFSSRKKCAERMMKLWKAGFVSRFQAPLMDVRGKPEYVYCRKGKGVRRGYGWVRHGLGVSEFFVWVSVALRTQKVLQARFISFGNVFGGLIVPDAVLVLSKGERSLLNFVEVDFGTESLKSGRGYSFGDKIDLYAEYFDCEEYRKDFDEGFRGFRVLAVFESQKRMKNYLDIAKDKGCDFVLCTTFEALNKAELLSKCWADIKGKEVDVVGKV